MGSLYLRGSTYWLKYYDSNGRPIRESSKSKVKAVATRLLKHREGEIASGKAPGIHFEKTTFDELSKDILTDYKVNAKKSLDRAELSVRHLAEFFGGTKAMSITTPRIKTYIERRMEAGAANATINRELACLRRLLNLGAKCTPPKVAQVPFIPMLAEDNVRKGFFEYQDFVAIREVLPEYLRGYLTFGYRSGWRAGEIRNLTWAQVDRANGIVRLEPGSTKNKQGRTLYLDDELKAVIEDQWIMRKRGKSISPYVFVNPEGTDRIRDPRNAWRTAAKKIGKPWLLFHDLRRTAVRNLCRAGVNERIAMAITGHKTRAVFDRYNIVSESDLRMATERQAAYLEAQSGRLGTVSGTVALKDKREAAEVSK
jgi:integrase